MSRIRPRICASPERMLPLPSAPRNRISIKPDSRSPTRWPTTASSPPLRRSCSRRFRLPSFHRLQVHRFLHGARQTSSCDLETVIGHLSAFERHTRHCTFLELPACRRLLNRHPSLSPSGETNHVDSHLVNDVPEAKRIAHGGSLSSPPAPRSGR